MHRPRAPLRCTRGAAGAKKAAWTGANWKRIDFPPMFQLDLSSAHVYSTNPSFPPLALIGLQSFLPPLLALTAFLNEPQKFSSISCKGKFSLGNDQVWPEISSADAIFRSAFSEIFSCIYISKWFAFLLIYCPIKWTFLWQNAFSGYLAIWRHTYKEDECQKSVELPETTNKLIWCNVRKLELVREGSGYQIGWFFCKSAKGGSEGHFQYLNICCRFWEL